MLQWAFDVAERPEDKNLATDRVSTVRTMETPRWLVKLLDDEVVAQEACRSIVDLAHHRDLRNPNRDESVKALRRVIGVSQDASLVSRASRHSAREVAAALGYRGHGGVASAVSRIESAGPKAIYTRPVNMQQNTRSGKSRNLAAERTAI